MTSRGVIGRLGRAVAPRLALRRAQARFQLEMAERYKGASRRRSGGESWATVNGDADADTLLDLPTLRERSRSLLRNNPLAGAAVGAKVTNIVGTGLKLQSNIDREYLGLNDEEADAWEAKAETYWRLWSESQNCDIRRGLTFAEHQELAFRSVLENGDHFLVLRSLDRPLPGWPFGFALCSTSRPTG